MGKYWVCDTCRIVDVDASGYKTTRESVTSKEGEIAVFLKRTCDALEKYNEVFRERTENGTLSAFDNELLGFSSKFHIAKRVIQESMPSCDKFDKLLQQELYQILTLMESDTAKELLKEKHHG
jgi:hypothetical protein